MKDQHPSHSLEPLILGTSREDDESIQIHQSGRPRASSLDSMMRSSSKSVLHYEKDFNKIVNLDHCFNLLDYKNQTIPKEFEIIFDYFQNLQAEKRRSTKWYALVGGYPIFDNIDGCSADDIAACRCLSPVIILGFSIFGAVVVPSNHVFCSPLLVLQYFTYKQ